MTHLFLVPTVCLAGVSQTPGGLGGYSRTATDLWSGLEVFISLAEKSGNKSLGGVGSNCPQQHFSSWLCPSRRPLLPFQEGDRGRRDTKASNRTQRGRECEVCGCYGALRDTERPQSSADSCHWGKHQPPAAGLLSVWVGVMVVVMVHLQLTVEARHGQTTAQKPYIARQLWQIKMNSNKLYWY